MTDVGDEMCWRQLWDIGDGFYGTFYRYGHQHPLSFNISNVTLALGINILKISPISKLRHQQPKIVTNVYVAPYILWSRAKNAAYHLTLEIVTEE